MAEREKPTWLKKIKIPAFILVGLIALYAAIGFWLLPYLIKSKLPDILQEKLNRAGSIQEVAINPFLFEVDLKGFEIQRKQGGRFVGFDEFFVNFEMSSLFKRAVTFDAIRLTGLFVEVDKFKDGKFNFDDLIESSDDEEDVPEEDEDSDPFPVWISNLEIQRGNVVFNDQSRKTPFRTEITPIDLSITDFHTYLDGGSKYQFNAKFDSGGSFDWEGEFDILPLSSKGRINLSEIKPYVLWAYIQDTVNFKIVEGAFNLDAQYDIHMEGDALQATVSDGVYVLENLNITQKGKPDPVINIPRIALEGIAFNLLKQKLSIESLSSQNARIHGWVRPDKQMNFVELFSVVQGNEPAPTSAPAEPSDGDSEWLVTVKKIAFNDYGFLFEDRSLATTMSLNFQPLNITVENFSSDMKGKLPFTIQSAINQAGHMDVGGDLGLDPLSTDVKLDLKLNLKDFQPYIDPVTKLEFGKGDAIVKGDVKFAMDENAKLQLQFNGMASIDDFVGQDKSQKKKLLKWSALKFDGVDFNLDPITVGIKEVTADQAYTRFIINEDGTTNFSKVFSGENGSGSGAKKANVTSDKKTEKSPDAVVKIAKVTVKNTSAFFADRSLTPKFETGMEELNGSIRGISTVKNSRAKINLKGKADKTAPLKIKGEVNVSDPQSYLDIGLDFKNLSLTSLTPYSGKFAGYKIEKGKMSMDLNYKIKKKKLAATNKIVIDQLTLGDEVDSPDAVSLPLSLAIALLKDADGVIDIDLPLKGSLDDPEFSIWGIAGDVLMNMITKVVTSPFAVLGGLVGDNEELNVVGFDPGKQEVTAEQKEKLGQVAEAMEKRPALNIEIEGVADDADAEQQFRNAILADKNSALANSAEEAETDAERSQVEPTLSEEDYKRYLLQAYYKKIAGMNSLSLNAPMIEQQLNSEDVLASARRKVYGSMLSEDSRLRDLAQARGRNIREVLIAQGLNPDRIFLLDVNLESNEESKPDTETLVLSKLVLNAN